MARAARDTQGEKARPLGAQPPALGARKSHLQSRRFHRLLPCRYGAGRSGHDARPADAVWRAEAECGVRGCSARGRCLQSSGGGKGGGIHTDGVDAGGAGGATTTTTTTTSCVCVDGAYGPACELGCENNSMWKTGPIRLPARPAIQSIQAVAGHTALLFHRGGSMRSASAWLPVKRLRGSGSSTSLVTRPSHESSGHA